MVWTCPSLQAHISEMIWSTCCHHLHALWCGLEVHTAHSDCCQLPLWSFLLQAQIDRNLNSPITLTHQQKPHLCTYAECFKDLNFEIQTIQEGDIWLRVLERGNEYQAVHTDKCMVKNADLSQPRKDSIFTSPFSTWEGVWSGHKTKLKLDHF